MSVRRQSADRRQPNNKFLPKGDSSGGRASQPPFAALTRVRSADYFMIKACGWNRRKSLVSIRHFAASFQNHSLALCQDLSLKLFTWGWTKNSQLAPISFS